MSSLSAHDRDRLLDLLDALRDGESGASESRELHRLVTTHDEAAAIYVQHMQLVASLRWRFDAIRSGGPVDALPIGRPRESRSRAGSLVPVAIGIAAMVLLTAAAVAIYVLAISNQATPATEEPTATSTIATLVDATDTVLFGNDIAHAGQDYSAGDYAIESGEAEILLSSGASVRMLGATGLTVVNEMRSVLRRGAAAFHCPPSAAGYTVELEGGVRVVDLGTRFVVAVGESDPDSVSVRVDEGRVRIDLPDGSSQTVGAGVHAHVRSGHVVAQTAADVRVDFVAARSTSDESSPFAVASGDLLETAATLRLESGEARFESAVERLADGVKYDGQSQTATQSTFTPSDGSVLIVTFDTDANPAGYDIDRIVSLTGTGGINQFRSAQRYTVHVRTVGSDAFVPLAVVGPDPGNVDAASAEVRATITGVGAQLASAVAALRFEFAEVHSYTDNPLTPANGESMYREIDVFGSPTQTASDPADGDGNADGAVTPPLTGPFTPAPVEPNPTPPTNRR